MFIGYSTRRAVRIRIKDNNMIAHGMCSHNKHSSQLTAAQHTQCFSRQNHDAFLIAYFQ